MAGHRTTPLRRRPFDKSNLEMFPLFSARGAAAAHIATLLLLCFALFLTAGLNEALHLQSPTITRVVVI
jgi:hypothetical protein